MISMREELKMRMEGPAWECDPQAPFRAGPPLRWQDLWDLWGWGDKLQFKNAQPESPSKYQWHFFMELEQKILRICIKKTKIPWILKGNPSRRCHAPWFQTVLKSYSNQGSVAWSVTRHTDQWAGEDPEGNPRSHCQSVHNEGGRLNSGERPELFDKQQNCTTAVKRDQVIFHVIYQTKLKID